MELNRNDNGRSKEMKQEEKLGKNLDGVGNDRLERLELMLQKLIMTVDKMGERMDRIEVWMGTVQPLQQERVENLPQTSPSGDSDTPQGGRPSGGGCGDQVQERKIRKEQDSKERITLDQDKKAEKEKVLDGNENRGWKELEKVTEVIDRMGERMDEMETQMKAALSPPLEGKGHRPVWMVKNGYPSLIPPTTGGDTLQGGRLVSNSDGKTVRKKRRKRISEKDKGKTGGNGSSSRRPIPRSSGVTPSQRSRCWEKGRMETSHLTSKEGSRTDWLPAWREVPIRRPIQCYGCWTFGHIQKVCPMKGVNRRSACYACGRPGHVSRGCPSASQCMACTDLGMEWQHRMGGPACGAAARAAWNDWNSRLRRHGGRLPDSWPPL